MINKLHSIDCLLTLAITIIFTTVGMLNSFNNPYHYIILCFPNVSYRITQSQSKFFSIAIESKFNSYVNMVFHITRKNPYNIY